MLSRFEGLLIYLPLVAMSHISCAATNTTQEIGPLSQRQLRERFRTDKNEYLVAEPIFFTQWLENTGSKAESPKE